MKTDKNQIAWQRLVEAARSAPSDKEQEAPFGFSSRIAARAFDQSTSTSVAALLDRLSLRALFAACALMVGCLATSYSLSASSSTSDDYPVPQDPVAEILEVSS